MIETGQKAPNFTLFDNKKNQISLADYGSENVVLLFFPLAFTSTCTTELCHMRDNIADYNNLETEVLGISVDSLYALDKFKQELELNFPLLSDFNREVSQAYGALYSEFSYGMKNVSKRSAFVIDSGGIVRYAEVLENAGELPDFDKIMGTLRELNQE